MKKMNFMLFAMLLSACSVLNTNTDNTDTWTVEKNENCADFKAVKVFQTLDNGALAMVCDSGDTKYCSGMVVGLKKTWDLELWDEKVVVPPKEKCFTYDDTITYQTKDERTKTVPVLGFGYEYSSQSSEEALNRLAEMTTSLYMDCKYHFEKGNKSIRAEGLKLCECYKQATTDTIEEMIAEEEFQETSKQVFSESVMTKMETCNKKYPKASKAY